MISRQQVHRFILKTPDERRITTRFLASRWLAKLPYAPHRVRLRITPSEDVTFWWSCFPGGVGPESETIFDYWGDDAGDLRLLWRLLQPGMTFLDVGAYHGIYTIIAVKKLGQSGSVVAFEPSPREQRRLRLHLKYNGMKWVKVEPYALAGREGKASLHIVTEGFTTMNSLRQPAVDHPRARVEVEALTLDAYLKRERIGKVDFLKVDAESAELEIFGAANKLLRQLRPLIICEVLDGVTAPWGYPAREIVSHLQTYSYQWFDILPDGNLLPHRSTDQYPDVRNYLAVPEEKLDRVREFAA
jgi:FkbM family methyltransferase